MSEPLASAVVIDGLYTSNWDAPESFALLREGGVTAINATVAILEDFDAAMANLQTWPARFARHADLIRPVRDVDDIARAKEEGRTGVILGWQNATPLGDDVGRVVLFHELGVRIVQLTYNERNLIGDGCLEPANAGLSRFGHAVIEELNRVGMLIDLSHCGDRTTDEAIEASSRPVAITHANARSQIDHPRNKPDATIRRLVERGGVIGANAFPGFFPRRYDTTLAEYLDAIECLVELAGVDHVALGSDFCHAQPEPWFRWIFSTSYGHEPPAELPPMPEPHRGPVGFEDPRAFPALAGGLLDRGYGQDDVRKILGENWLRLLAEVWAPDSGRAWAVQGSNL